MLGVFPGLDHCIRSSMEKSRILDDQVIQRSVMQRSMQQITSKKGTPINSAAFSLAHSIWVKAKSKRSRRERDIKLDPSDPMFHAIIDIAKECDEITIKSSGISHGTFVPDDHVKFRDRVAEIVTGLIKNHESCGFILIYTKTVDEIRALAKEIRTDIAVAKAAKIPKKPKADLKNRRDVI